MPAASAGNSQSLTEVASLLLPALIETEIAQVARELAAHKEQPARQALHRLHLRAMAGRMLAPGGWVAGLRRAGAEPWTTGRARPYDESTLRKSARAMVGAGAVPIAERALLDQVRGHVGSRAVTAFTDLYDQVNWTKEDAWAGPVGGLGNRILACTYFGLTFVRVEKGPTLALHVSWHKPASPLIDALVALHGEPDRALWLREHVVLQVLDRGTQYMSPEVTLHQAAAAD